MATQPQVKPIHFFRIITLQNLHQGKLMFPEKFVEKYGEGLSTNTLFLSTPNGAEWKLNLEKCDGKIWFQKGWKEFAEYHSLAHGHLLVFRCQRTSHFQLRIFDWSALEIEYPSKRIECETGSNNQGNTSTNVGKFEYHRPGQKRKDNSSLEFVQRYQLRSRNCLKVEKTEILPKEILHHTGTKCKEKSKATANQVSALDRASSFKPCNPFFLVVMHPYNVGSRCLLGLPCEFCRSYIDLHDQQRHINLQELNGRVWPSRYLITKNNRNTKPRYRLKSGWKAFVKHNNLKVGDVCTFELICRTKLTLLVHIFRETDSSNCSTPQGRIDFYFSIQNNSLYLKVGLIFNFAEKSKATTNQVTALDRANSFKPCNPFFLAVIHPSYLGSSAGHLGLPCEFCRSYIDLHDQQRHINLQELNGRVWPSRYLITKNNRNTKPRYRLKSGWKAFVKHNNLKVGDVCTFELICRTKLTLLVHIFRETDSSNCSTPQGRAGIPRQSRDGFGYYLRVRVYLPSLQLAFTKYTSQRS
uniref:B3 domain-containing transcription factor VRN1 n=1 Tax=Cajanus cajan TaxID=3821 RepID=A0A151QXI3_CAJCA|nr:B3 domain-containing transcription factor VRN1 [Cajanus cajan]